MTIPDLPEKDLSVVNPKLHRLYVTYAQEDLAILNKAIEAFDSVSRVNMSICCGLLVEQKQMLIKSDTAYREALWRIEVNDLLIPESED